MTFRPSDDVLDETSKDQQVSLDQNNFSDQGDWQHIFSNPEDSDSTWAIQNEWINPVLINFPVEEVKAPDLSELLKNWWENNTDDKNLLNEEENKTQNIELSQEPVNLNSESSIVSDEQNLDKTVVNAGIVSSDGNAENNVNNQDVNHGVQISQQDELDYVDSDKLPDTERHAIISSIEWSISSNLDFLVDNGWFNVVKKYKKVNRLFFRWFVFTLITIIGILSWVFLQVKASTMGNLQMIDDSFIENKSKWIEETPDKIFSPFVDKWVGVDVSIPYGSVSTDWTIVNSKSNLLLYKWVVLPQLSSIDYDSDDFVLLENFNSKKLVRADIENLVETLITKNSIYKKTTNLPNVSSSRWIWNKFSSTLEDGFNLSCLSSQKVSDFVCDKFLERFYDYGKYYDLNEYDSELPRIFENLRNEGKDIKPVCEMIKEYTLHVGKTSDTLISVMDYCWEDDARYYRKLVNFIDLENSLWQPTLPSKVFDDPDLNAYKLLSAQQNVHRFLEGTTSNEAYFKSYLEFAQTLLDKDKGTNRYLHPIYKDILYVFNVDELSEKLMKKWNSSDILLQIDQINNWGAFWSVSLLSQLTTSDIIKENSDFTGITVNDKSLEDLFAQYYAMTDRLKIRKTNIISEDEIKVQTEIFTDKILGVTDGQTLKVTLVLRRQDNLLYVDSIKVANQPKFTDILGIYLREWNVTFYAMLNYIDEQVWMWYEVVPENLEEQPSLCEELMEREDIDVYICDDSAVSIYKWEVGYDFVLEDWVLVSFTITDENLDAIIKEKLEGVLFMRDSTPSMITSIIDFSVELGDDALEKKMEIIEQFRIHFKTEPNYVYDVEWKSDVFLVDFTLWDFNLQGYYNMDTHVLSKISYKDCPKPLEIKQLTLEITSENESQLIEILNNPRVFFASVSPSIYSKYKNACWWK